MQDNNPIHVSKKAQAFHEEKNMNWWYTPPEYPDTNTTENLWHEFKEFIWREVKPNVKAEHVLGIQPFWDTVDTQKCQKYIGHLRKVTYFYVL